LIVLGGRLVMCSCSTKGQESLVANKSWGRRRADGRSKGGRGRCDR